MEHQVTRHVPIGPFPTQEVVHNAFVGHVYAIARVARPVWVLRSSSYARWAVDPMLGEAFVPLAHAPEAPLEREFGAMQARFEALVAIDALVLHDASQHGVHQVAIVAPRQMPLELRSAHGVVLVAPEELAPPTRTAHSKDASVDFVATVSGDDVEALCSADEYVQLNRPIHDDGIIVHPKDPRMPVQVLSDEPRLLQHRWVDKRNFLRRVLDADRAVECIPVPLGVALFGSGRLDQPRLLPAQLVRKDKIGYDCNVRGAAGH
eukprot:scaffold17176_cov128-Isochrysis_galbana.AAC.2